MATCKGTRPEAEDDGGGRDKRSSGRHEQTRGELALWSEIRAGSPKIRVRLGERDSGCFTEFWG